MNLSKAAAALGRKGGLVKVRKGFATMSPERLSEIAKAAIQKRWDTERKQRDGATDNSGSGKTTWNRGGNSQ